jgi:hypothetical protein
MALFVLTVNNNAPALDKKFQEVVDIARALTLAAQDIGSHGGANTTGNIIDTGGQVVGSWTYTPQASS